MRSIGNSDLHVFPLVLGGNTFGWTSDSSTSFEVLDAFIAAGGTMIDTADGYSFWVDGNSGGESESIIGSWLRSRGQRDRVQIATKVSTHPRFTGLTAETIAGAADASLRRLGVDQIDLYYAHYDDPETPLEESIEAFEALIKAGKVRHVGLSNFSAKRVQEWINVVSALGATSPVALQPHYNLLHRKPFETDYSDLVARNEMGVLPYFALAAGLLTGKYTTQEQVRGTDREGQMRAYLNPATFDVVNCVVDIAAELNVAPAAVAIGWLRGRSGVAAPIASARHTGQLEALVAGAVLELPKEALDRLENVSTPHRI